MPNWSFNEVRITGNTETLEKIRRQVRVSYMSVGPSYLTPSNQARISTREFALEGVIPRPPIVKVQYMNNDEPGEAEKVLREYCARHGIDSSSFTDQTLKDTPEYWHNWCSDNWGTKWDTSNAYVDMPEGSDELFASFDTAWGPPEPVFEELSRQYPDVLIECKAEIEGWDNYIMRWRNGKKIYETSYLGMEDMFEQADE